MPAPTPSALTTYRVITGFLGMLPVALSVLYSTDGPLVSGLTLGPAAYSLLCGAVVAGSALSRTVRRHYRTVLYALYHLGGLVLVTHCVKDGFTPSTAVALLFGITLLGMGGGVSSRSAWPIGSAIGTTTVAGLVGLLVVPDPGVGRVGFGLVLVAQGLTMFVVTWQRIRSRARIDSERAQYRDVFERATDGIYLSDFATRRVLDANPAYLRLVGYSLAELQTLTVDDLVHVGPGELAVDQHTAALLQNGRHVIGPRRHRTRDGRLLDVEVNLSTVDIDGRNALCAVVRDATAQRETERRLQEAARRSDEARALADEARDRAEALLCMKTSLLENLSHEIRTPLTGVLGYSALLEEDLEGENQEMARAVTRCGSRLLGTLNALLDLARLDAEEAPLPVGPLDLAALAAAAADRQRPAALAKGLCLTVAADRPQMALGEPVAVQRVLDHLIGNAVKFTDAGDVRVRVESGADAVRIVVDDTGIGIDPALLPAVFEPFAQASTGHGRSHEGVGLGLTIARRLAERMGGRIEAASLGARGARFTLLLPPARPLDAAQPAREPAVAAL